MDFMLCNLGEQSLLYLPGLLCRSAITAPRIGYNSRSRPACRRHRGFFNRYFHKASAPLRTHMADTSDFVIQGITPDGKPFRPSDWADRLAGVMCSFGGDNRMAYSPYCYPFSIGGVKCVAVDSRLKEIEPMAYGFLLNFARDNELQVKKGNLETLKAEAAK
jgi:Protein of unknown function (DUF3579)